TQGRGRGSTLRPRLLPKGEPPPATPVDPAPVRQDGRILLSRKYKEGDVVKSRVSISTTIQGVAITITHSGRDTVKAIQPDGTILIETIGEGGTSRVGEEITPQPPLPPSSE